jgi:hypothetical protein
MTMSTGAPKSKDIERILGLKGQQLPPEEYFDQLRDHVLHNLNAPERPETMSWLQRIGVHFDVSPAIVGTVGIIVCGLLAGGITFALRAERPRPALPLEPLDVSGVALGQPGFSGPGSSRATPANAKLPRSTEPVTTADDPDPGILPPPAPPTTLGDGK